RRAARGAQSRADARRQSRRRHRSAEPRRRAVARPARARDRRQRRALRRRSSGRVARGRRARAAGAGAGRRTRRRRPHLPSAAATDRDRVAGRAAAVTLRRAIRDSRQLAAIARLPVIRNVVDLLRTRAGWFIAVFLVLQLALPLHYYVLRRDPHDERFAWRM